MLWSSRSVKTRWVRAEAAIGARKNTLVPLMIEEGDCPVMFELIQTTDLSKWQGDRTDPARLAFIEVIPKRLAAAPIASRGSESRGGAPSASRARKRVKPPKQKQRSGGGLLPAVMLTFVFAMVSAAGICILRPDLARPILTQLSKIAAASASLAAEMIDPSSE